MRRVLLAAGCNRYDHMGPEKQLRGAETDARRVYELLVERNGDYGRDASTLMLSPSLMALKGALGSLFGVGPIDVLTLYFAGHGGVKDGYYYLCPSDARLENLSLSAWSLEEFFRIVSELRPREVNVVMDACQAGAAMRDVGGLLKPEIVGKANSLSVSFLAAAAPNQYAGEVSEGGIATTELIRYLEGERVAQESRPFLDLVEVGRAVSAEVGERMPDQTPVAWGLNLYGIGRFARNPRFSGHDDERREAVANLAPFMEVGAAIGRRSDELWELYESVLDDPAYGKLMSLLSEVCASIVGGAPRAAPFVRGVSSSFRARVVSSPDLLAETNVVASCAAALLPVVGEDEAQILVWELLEERAKADQEARTALADGLRSDRYALLSPGGSLSDFYYLPIRVTGILGWLASSVLAQHLLGVGEEGSREESADLAQSVIERYSGSIVAMSDEQAPHAYLFAQACRLWERPDLAREVTSRLFQSLRAVGGAVTKVNVGPSEAFEYTWLRSNGNPAEASNALANPSQFLPCLALCGADLDMTDEMNAGMRSFDGRFVNMFLPENYARFADEYVRPGINHHRRIGHGVWRVDDIVQVFEQDCRPSIEGNETIQSAEARTLCLLASSLLPDRVPYFLQLQSAMQED